MSREEGEVQLLPYVLVLHAFCLVDPGLCTPASDPTKFVITLQPYLKSQVIYGQSGQDSLNFCKGMILLRAYLCLFSLKNSGNNPERRLIL